MSTIGTATNKKILEIFNMMKSGDLILRPSFQRKLVWNNKHKEAFINTILEGLPFPEIYLADGEIDLKTQRSKTLVVDGQQRLSTIYQYIIGDKTFTLSAIPLFDELSATDKTNFYDYMIVVRDLGRIDEDKIIEIFKRINSVQYALNAIEIQNALYEGEFISTAREIIKYSKFSELEIFTETEYSRMRDWEYALLIMATIEEGGYFNSNKEVDTFIVKFDEIYPGKDQIKNEVIAAINILYSLKLDADTIWYRKSTNFSLIVELIKFKRCVGFFPDIEKLKSLLINLENEILENKDKGTESNEFASFYKYMYSGTSGKTARDTRGALLGKYFKKLV